MPNVLDNIIVEAVADPQASTVVVTWANGSQTIHTFRRLMGTGVMADLADAALFAQVGIGERGRSLEWPGDIDFCADALWFEAHPEDAPKQFAEHQVK